MPAETTSLLRQLLALTEELVLPDDDEALELWLDRRQALLDQLAALPPELRSLQALSPEELALFEAVRAQGDELMFALESRRAQLNHSQGELRQTHSAMKAYLPDVPAESHYIEEET